MTTVVGDTYSIGFFFASAGEPGQELLVTLGNVTVEDLVNLPGSSSGPYSFYSATAVASGTTTRLEFQGRQDPSFNALDDIVVTDVTTATAPEPATLLFLPAAVAVLALSRRRLS